ncbi:MAG: flagellar export chaperone FliS [Planctomycetes bacterium]|nr:flagellar export chaperone FliS [Planctomycetota bacterium]
MAFAQSAYASPDAYLKTKVLTASPVELRLMLFDGAIKFCRQGRHALGQQKFEAMYNALTRAQNIVLELSNSLKHEHDPALCDKLTALYHYIYRRLVDANIGRDIAAVDETIKLLEYERETWVMLMKRLAEDEGQSPPAPAAADDEHHPGPIASIGPERPAYGQPAAAPARFSAQG